MKLNYNKKNLNRLNFIKENLIFFISILVICICSYIVYSNYVGYYTNPSAGMGAILAESLGGTVIIGLLLKKTTLSKLRKLYYWVACFAIIMPVYSINDIIKVKKEKTHVSNFLSERLRILNKDLTKPFTLDLEKDYGKYKDLLIILNEGCQESDKIWLNLENLAKKIESSLGSINLSELKSIKEAEKILTEVLNELTASKIAFDNCFDNIRLQIQNINNSDIRTKSSMISNFKENRIFLLIDQYFDVEKEAILSILELIKFIADKQGLYYHDNDQIIFQNEIDQNKFNQLVKKIEKGVDKEEEIILKIEECKKEHLLEIQKLLDGLNKEK